ncbi:MULTISPECIES: hypothetical protein [Acinetobacter calcoaceticus/baumannii complex]|uniref:hypothetical protein n=1 Tax=Acinetobacter calcoaceticus/baumannii complex TaxID=909768 RepID=UPI001ADD4E86|nr:MULTISPECIES: hypothetical protein [Acinetobacter calcoaceticus/baumannii complex]MBO8215383.1 hypothetical protein [Acinetobacter nosocomialis]MDV7367651.1 hypothetical protein [Acinetobacter baumannii]MDV7643811.1 hypothetical protein [Acinetobacter baumannii]
MDKIQYKAYIVPRKKDESDLSWLLNNRKYLRGFEARKMYKEILSRDEVRKVSVDEWVRAKEATRYNDILLSIFTSAPDYSPSDIDSYLSRQETKDLGLALAIEYEKFDKFYSAGVDMQDIILYMENNILSQADMVGIKDNIDLVTAIFLRIIDKKKVMFINLIQNFLNLLEASTSVDLSTVFDEEKIAQYISHANFYSNDDLLEFLLTNFPECHPKFIELSFMHWDSFTKSRDYSRWLKAKSILNELSRYYLTLTPENEVIGENQEYIRGFLNFLTVCKD